MTGKAVAGAEGFTFIARRNNSLSPAGRLLVVGSLAMVTLAISLAFALHGAWLVLPFAGLEIAVVFLAFRYMERRAGDCECVSLRGDTVIVERHRQGSSERFEFNRCWVQVGFNRGPDTRQDRLVLRSHGKEVEFGVHLTAAQRAAVAHRLVELLKIA